MANQSEFPGRRGRNSVKRLLYGMLAACIAMPATGFAVDLGQIDDFEDGGTAGWRKGINSANQPMNISTGGPSGANDNYLQTISTGGFGADSKQVIDPGHGERCFYRCPIGKLCRGLDRAISG